MNVANHAQPSDAIPADLHALLQHSGLKPLTLRGRTLLPIFQGGMGVGVSGHRLAGTVAALGGVGTVSSVDLRRHYPDLMARTTGLPPTEQTKDTINAVNLEAITREIQAARALSEGRGLLAINIMRAVAEYAPSVQQALAAGIDAIVVGAGLPLDLPELTKDHPDTLLIPILSDARGVQLLVRKWERKQRLPDAIIIEHPKRAGGHLGAARIVDLNDARFDFEQVIPACRELFASMGVDIPLIAAGGIRSHEDIRHVQALGAAGVQLGTPFAVTTEGDAHPEFKRVLAEARDEDLAEFVSVAGLPARAVRTPWLNAYLKIEHKLQGVAHVKSRCTKAFDCLAQCGLRDGLPTWGQFCIDNQLAAALRGDVKKGLFFRGAGPLPFGDQIRSVRELLAALLGDAPAPALQSALQPAA